MHFPHRQGCTVELHSVSALLFRAVIIATPATKKNHGRLVCIERGPRCPACRLPDRPKCGRCGRTLPGRHAVQPSDPFRQFEKDALPQLKVKRPRRPIAVPVWVRATFYRERATGDWNGFTQALGDILEKAEVIENDRLIVHWDGTRLLKDARNPRVELEITPVDSPEPLLFEEAEELDWSDAPSYEEVTP